MGILLGKIIKCIVNNSIANRLLPVIWFVPDRPRELNQNFAIFAKNFTLCYNANTLGLTVISLDQTVTIKEDTEPQEPK